MSTIRAWKDPEYRDSLAKDALAGGNAHPAGPSLLTSSELEMAQGGTTWPCFGITVSIAACQGTKGYGSVGCC
ncbi:MULTISPECIES: mersacidin/lichenicidin family type 2 lantibiotic [Actinoalloteichus]|uniref:Type 2 lantibiotic, mersacidin/lichenicidin family n=1 Tax=Actinoalloteichus fjordicus TaxID=1612552 RepID=A0AAC9PR59_9PSEU|nr:MULTISPECIES: mersacidin/lichenicidin family type 2 lantibiotic [Actinoalloteichus]APU13954.1 type 2 lantibiotic, mersacidin/lichenicidin family [Actinoalloteichus fjordicus]APU19900.1 type 2 lantibiotic, mersacidin/lichenicidin family [Actinoalloteichus sp. GBA129-24]